MLAAATLGQVVVRRAGLREGPVRVLRHHRVEPGIQARDPVEHPSGQLHRGHGAGADGARRVPRGGEVEVGRGGVRRPRGPGGRDQPGREHLPG